MGTKIYEVSTVYARVVISNDGALLHINRDAPGIYYVSGFECQPHLVRRGYGSRLLRRLCAWADRVGAIVNLTCAPYMPHRMSFEDTQKLYTKFGFVPSYQRQGDAQAMRRQPRMIGTSDEAKA
jgi:GNAT superfamily N-acetyltransferase